MIKSIKKLWFNFKVKLILKLIGDTPVIVNCTIYDDVFEYNFGKTRAYKPCIAFNNRIRSFGTYAVRYNRSFILK